MGKGEFWSLFLFVTLAMSLAVSANNLLLLFLAIEFLSITSYMLVGIVRDDKRSTEAGRQIFPLWFGCFFDDALWHESALWRIRFA